MLIYCLACLGHFKLFPVVNKAAVGICTSRLGGCTFRPASEYLGHSVGIYLALQERAELLWEVLYTTLHSHQGGIKISDKPHLCQILL